jgi:hypothetical protein
MPIIENNDRKLLAELKRMLPIDVKQHFAGDC